MTNTRHSLLYVSLWEWALEQANSAADKRKWAEVYKYLASLMFALCRKDQWLGDTEMPEENQEVLDRLAEAWGELFARKDYTNWTKWERNVAEWKGALQDYAEKLKGYDTDGEAYKFEVPGVGA